MRRDCPGRLAGKLYLLAEPEARQLVESGNAEWEYVPANVMATLTSEEPKAKKPRKLADESE